MGILKTLIHEVLAEGEVDDEVRDARLEVCGSCKYLNEEKMQCKICSCFVEIKAGLKANKNPKRLFRIEQTHCPKGLWPFRSNDGEMVANDKDIADYYNKI